LAINHKRNLDKITAASFPHTVTRRVAEQMNLIVNDVKVTFFQYPFPVEPTAKFETYFRLPSLLQLAAMKACAFGRRSKWKDYVDLYFLLRDHFTIADITACATRLFGELFSEKMFRSQSPRRCSARSSATSTTWITPRPWTGSSPIPPQMTR